MDQDFYVVEGKYNHRTVTFVKLKDDNRFLRLAIVKLEDMYYFTDLNGMLMTKDGHSGWENYSEADSVLRDMYDDLTSAGIEFGIGGISFKNGGKK